MHHLAHSYRPALNFQRSFSFNGTGFQAPKSVQRSPLFHRNIVKNTQNPSVLTRCDVKQMLGFRSPLPNLTTRRRFTTSTSVLPNPTLHCEEASTKMYHLIKEKGQIDAYNNFVVDITALPGLSAELSLEKSAVAFMKALPILIAEQKEKGRHVFSLKIPSDNGRIMQYAIENGFRHHQGNPEFSVLNYCLQEHTAKACSFPIFRTVSIGVAGVVFDRTLEKVLVVMEKSGPIKKFKPPTGTVEYGNEQETPLEAVIRELNEETQIKVKPSDAVIVGTTWTNNYRGTNPDISYTFAFILPQVIKPISQEGEISKAKWMPVKDFLKCPPEEKDKPWMLRRIVSVAYHAMQNDKAWKPHTCYLSTGKPVTMYSAV